MKGKYFVYAIAYMYSDGNCGSLLQGISSCLIHREKEINTAEDFMEMSDFISSHNGGKKIAILNIMFIGEEEKET